MAGQMGVGNPVNGKDTVNTNTTHLSPRTLRLGNPTEWKDQAVMSQDGLFRPVWNGNTEGGVTSQLPRYTDTTKGRAAKWDLCWTERPHQTRHVNPPFNGDESYKPAINDISYLDPYAYPSKAKHDEHATSGTNYTDVGIIAQHKGSYSLRWGRFGLIFLP